MENETAHMNGTRFSSYVAHDHDPYALTYADLQSMYLLCKIHAYGRLGTKHEHTLPHTSKKGLVLKP